MTLFNKLLWAPRFVNGLAILIEPGDQLTDFTIFVFTVCLITPMSILSLLFSTRLVQYIDSTRFLLSTMQVSANQNYSHLRTLLIEHGVE